MASKISSEELTASLKVTIDLLSYVSENHWASWLRRDLAAIERGNFWGVEDLLIAYRGAGSFNDLYLARVNGHNVSERELPTINAQLEQLRSRLFDLASTMSRSHNEAI